MLLKQLGGQRVEHRIKSWVDRQQEDRNPSIEIVVYWHPWMKKNNQLVGSFASQSASELGLSPNLQSRESVKSRVGKPVQFWAILANSWLKQDAEKLLAKYFPVRLMWKQTARSCLLQNGLFEYRAIVLSILRAMSWLIAANIANWLRFLFLMAVERKPIDCRGIHLHGLANHIKQSSLGRPIELSKCEQQIWC